MILNTAQFIPYYALMNDRFDVLIFYWLILNILEQVIINEYVLLVLSATYIYLYTLSIDERSRDT